MTDSKISERTQQRLDAKAQELFGVPFKALEWPADQLEVTEAALRDAADNLSDPAYQALAHLVIDLS